MKLSLKELEEIFKAEMKESYKIACKKHYKYEGSYESYLAHYIIRAKERL